MTLEAGETWADVNVGEVKGKMRDKVPGFQDFHPGVTVFRILLPSLISVLSNTGEETRTYMTLHKF